MAAMFERVLAVGAQLGESPVWSARDGVLIFADISGKRLHRFDPASGAHETLPVAEELGCVAPALGGGYVAGMRSGVWLLDATGRSVERLAANPEDVAWSRFNDGHIDPAGRLIAGTQDEAKQGRGGFYRYDRRGLAKLAGGVQTSNGAAFSPDGKTLYRSDTPRFTIWRYAYDVATGEMSDRRVFAELDPSAADRARPDGAAVDADGCYWSALYDGGRVRRYDPDGKVMSEHPAPARKTTMPAFGGPDLRTLFLTAARDPDTGAGGDLYAMPVDTPGLTSTPFDPEA